MSPSSSLRITKTKLANTKHLTERYWQKITLCSRAHCFRYRLVRNRWKSVRMILLGMEVEQAKNGHGKCFIITKDQEINGWLETVLKAGLSTSLRSHCWSEGTVLNQPMTVLTVTPRVSSYGFMTCLMKDPRTNKTTYSHTRLKTKASPRDGKQTSIVSKTHGLFTK